jgi:hypothetical protein
MKENSGYSPKDWRKPSGADLFRERVSFRQPFDGTQPEVPIAEREVVARTFRSIVDDTLQNQPEDVRRVNSSGTVFLEVDLDEENKVAVVVDTGDKNMICVQHEMGNRGKEHFNYRIDETGTVIRYDSRDIPPIADSLTELKALPREEVEGFLSNVRANDDLERSMGLNKQPVSLNEMQGVKKLLSTAKSSTDLEV